MPLDPITMGKGGLMLANLIFGMNAQKQQNALLGQQLQVTRQNARDQKELATADRTDAFGNVTRYVPGQGFIVDNTAQTQAILDAQQFQELMSQTVDADRNRAAVERMDERSQKGDEAFLEAFNKRDNRAEETEQSNQSEQILRALDSRSSNKNNDTTKAFANASIRQGNPALFAKALQEGSGESLIDTINSAKDRGTERFFARGSAQDSKDFGEQAFLKSLADTTSASPLINSNIAGGQDASKNNALQTLMQAMQSGSSSTANALTRLAQGTRAPDLSGFVDLLDEFGPSFFGDGSGNNPVNGSVRPIARPF